MQICEHFLKPLMRRGHYFMDNKSYETFQTGKYTYLEKDGTEKTACTPNSYNGAFQEVGERQGIRFKRISADLWLLTIPISMYKKELLELLDEELKEKNY